MTCIIWQYKNGKITMTWDHRTTWWYNIVSKVNSKIIKLWDNLIWTSWDYVDILWLEEIYKMFLETEWPLINRIKAMSFYKLLMDYLKNKDVSMMIMNKDFQIIIVNGLIENMEINNNEWLFSMWSWHIIPMTLRRYDKNITLEDMYKIIWELDTKCTSTFNTLTIE